MSTPHNVVIVGGGLAGAKSAEALREQGFDGSITLLTAEPELPYERPPLSKGYLAGQDPFEQAIVHPKDWYADQRIDLRLSTLVTALDPTGHTIRCSETDGRGEPTELRYDKLILATGSTARHLPIAGADAEGVASLRRRDDADLIASWFGTDKRLVIIGGGWIGLEVAAAARGAGTEVTVLESASLPLLRVLGTAPARVFAEPCPVAVLGESGRPVRLSDRGAMSSPPARFRPATPAATPDATPAWQPVTAWAGPWPVDEQWWEPAGSAQSRPRLVARFQVVGADGRAWLLRCDGDTWVTEASYD